jgi:hypothetical protein
MSKWRQKGFVRDSDEDEEESQLESQGSRRNAALRGRERVNKTSKTQEDPEEAESNVLRSIETELERSNDVPECVQAAKQAEPRSPVMRSTSPRRPTTSPFTPATTHSSRREPTESPDPLQSSLTPRSQNPTHNASSQLLGSPTFRSSCSPPNPRQYVYTTTSPRSTNGPLLESDLPKLRNTEKAKAAPNILGAFGIEPLSDASDDELSDPPTDLESPENYIMLQPHRKTAVQVVIPSSTALQRQILEHEARREFRQRKPIQLHPYALEGERYRREVQSRGLKPVPRPRSPEHKTAHQNAETQEKDFDPNETPASSPPELEIPVSTPVIRKQRKDKMQSSSATLRIPNLARRGLSATQLRLPHSTKRRKLNAPLTQAAIAPTNVFEEDVLRRDIWSVPPNSPPYSSSPLLDGSRLAGKLGSVPSMTPAPNLPTPSTSSVFLEDPQDLPDSDLDLVPRIALRSGDGLRRPTRIVLSDESSSASESSSEAEQGDKELLKVGKKMKGVLPASWLRFDREAQDRRKAQARDRERLRQDATLSLETIEPQRGVAQRILKRNGGGGASSSSTPTKNVVNISDGSDDERGNLPYSHVRDVQNSAEDATALAATFDRRYADDDSDNMENDRLHLFTLTGTGTRRKKQVKLTDAFGKVKRGKTSDGTVRRSSKPVASKKRQHARSQAAYQTPPLLSVVDLDMSPSERNGRIPHFLRIARRQALLRPDLARQSLQKKQIRLHNARDTEDANATLQQWRQGGLRPKTNVKSQRKIRRQPLIDKSDNHQTTQDQSQDGDASRRDHDIKSVFRPQALRSKRPANRPSALELFRQTPTQRIKPSQHFKPKMRSNNVLERSARRPPVTFREGQLEDDESVFGKGHRNIAFENGLRHADRQAPIPAPPNSSYMNPQLARFLADNDAALPPLPSAQDIGGEPVQDRPKQGIVPKRRMLRKKMQAQRIDVEAREYRQPSEPAVQEILIYVDGGDEGNSDEKNQLSLQGLGPHGTRYPTTFDVTYLQSETYFHSSTLVGSEDLRRALSIGTLKGRDFDEPAGYCTIIHEATAIRSGPWNDETSSALHDMARDITSPLDEELMGALDGGMAVKHQALISLTRFLRSIINYVSVHLSFSDPVDRKVFLIKMHQLIFTLFDQISVVHTTSYYAESTSRIGRTSLQVMTCLLVLGVQTYRVAQKTIIESSLQLEVQELVCSIAKGIITHVIRNGVSELGTFLEQNKRHATRQNGVQEDDVLVESVVVCMHSLEKLNLPGSGFWDFVNEELSPATTSATHIRTMEFAWATLFTLVPFLEVDISGIPSRVRRESFSGDNWGSISTMMRRMFELYPSTFKKHGSSLNEYVRANLARCHRLIKHWHWQRPEQMLNVVFDFFGKNGLRQLRRESTRGPTSFFDHVTAEQPLTLEINESSFHVALRCLVLGLRGMRKAYSEKKIRSFVFRTIPNHGRSYPKDQPLDEESLAALRNHHDLLCTLYCAAPSPCRPRLDLIRGLVSHEASHREACRVNVRAWSNLTIFQLSADESYASAKPFALWHKDIMHQTLKQYQLARTEADDYLKSGVLDGTTDVSAIMVRHTMERNQEQVIATLRDCIAGMRKAIQAATDQNPLNVFLVDSDIVHLLELPHLEDRRLVNVIRDTLALLQEYVKSQKVTLACKESQQTSEESQDYGDFPDIDDLNDIEIQAAEATPQCASVDFLQTPLWHLLSNAFGAEVSPDDNLLMDCVDTWVLVANAQVSAGARSWSYYVDSFSPVSWQQLRHTEQTRKFGPYFLASLGSSDSAAYEQHNHEFVTALLLSLVDRESLLRFQHRLLHTIARVDVGHPLLRNLPFFRDKDSGDWDITADTLRSRRLALISSILSNMRDDLHATASDHPARTSEVRRSYATMLKEFMTRMKNNYQQLQQGTTITGAYVEFVQKMVQFLKQYTGDICPVLPFFTDSVAFPLPSTDPTYVVGRLCGYAPKAMDPGTAKQLSVFIQTVAQQAAADNQQSYLVNQLTTALCSDEVPAVDRTALRSVLLQGIFPAYLENAFRSSVAFVIARPIMQSLGSIMDQLVFDLRIVHPDNVSSIVESIIAISHAFIRGTEQLKHDSSFLKQPHVLSGSSFMLEAMSSMVSVLQYICDRTMTTARRTQPPVISYMEELSVFITEMLHIVIPHTIPFYPGDANAASSNAKYTTLFAFCKQGLKDSQRANWSERDGAIWFGQGHAKRDVIFDIGSVQEEQTRLLVAIESFQRSLRSVYGEEKYRNDGEESFGCDVFV